MKFDTSMGMVREPEGIDFLVKSKPPTKEELALMSAHILAYKENAAKKRPSKQTAPDPDPEKD